MTQSDGQTDTNVVCQEREGILKIRNCFKIKRMDPFSRIAKVTKEATEVIPLTCCLQSESEKIEDCFSSLFAWEGLVVAI